MKLWLIRLGSWAALILGLIYTAAFAVLWDKADLAVGVAFAALSLSIMTYGRKG